jgi:uncharacterized paraquat-inducible protein A
MSKLKTLNKETVSFVLLNDLNLPAEVIGEIVEIIWRSDDRLEEIQRANTACSGRAWACPHCGYQLNKESSLLCERCEIARR